MVVIGWRGTGDLVPECAIGADHEHGRDALSCIFGQNATGHRRFIVRVGMNSHEAKWGGGHGVTLLRSGSASYFAKGVALGAK